MYRYFVVLTLALAPVAYAPGSPEQTHQVKLNGHTFTLPEGFTIEVAVGADMAPRPIAAAFDEKGRLYVTDSSGSNAKVTEQVKDKPHRVLRLESTKGDGKFDKQTVFVKNIMFPEGCMWLNGSLYVAAPPHIWKFTDTNHDGVADKEEIWFDGKTLTGCANDLHGPYRGPDGYIYWTKGAFAKQEHTLDLPLLAPLGRGVGGEGKRKFSTRASHIFRAKPDGTGLEPVMTGGMDNPVDLVFTPSGDIIFSTTFFQHPGGGKRDGLIHAIYGGVYGKDHDVVYEHSWTAPTLMPVLTHMGPAAPAGLHRYESAEFGKDYANNIFCCQFNLRKVSRHVLVPKGSTYETRDSDFVVSDNIDFHPTDVIEDADGSLLIVDTGGWYKLCCPTSQLVKPDVTGAIYRVRKVGAHKIDDPRGEKIGWAKLNQVTLTRLFNDPRPVVRQRVTDLLHSRGGTAVATPQTFITPPPGSAFKPTEQGRATATWMLAGNDSPEARRATRALLTDAQAEVRLVAIQAAALWRDADAVLGLLECLKHTDPHTRRQAVAALGRIGDRKAIPAIRTALQHNDNDRALDHALTFALIEIGNADATAALLTDANSAVRRAGLAALSNIPDSGLDTKAVFAELDAKDAALRETAWWIAGRHPQWGANLATYFVSKMRGFDALAPAERDELAARLSKFASEPTVQKLLGVSLTGAKPEPARFVLGVMARSGLKVLPAAWRDGLTVSAPRLDDRDTLRAALVVFRTLPADVKDYDAFVAKLPRAKLWPGGVVPPDFRLALLAARPAGQPLDVPAMSFLATALDREMPAPDRSAAADVLARSTLTADQLAELAGVLKTATPIELPKLIAAFEKSKDEKVGLALVSALSDPAVRPAVRTEMVKPILDKYPQAVKVEAEKLYAELAEARKGETARLEKLLKDMPTGDIRRGQLVFNSAKTNCIACHKVGYVGGTAGPDLTRIGGIRSERDLFESVIFPSASFVRSYEPYRVVTKDERTLNGILKKDAPDEIIIVTAADKEERVSRADIESIAPSTVSLMPAGMEQQLTPQELADLIAFLRACK